MTCIVAPKELLSFELSPFVSEYHERLQQRLQQRSKQIEFGCMTEGYAKLKRFGGMISRNYNDDAFCLLLQLQPHITPPSVHDECSKRAWDAKIRKWRRVLHCFDDVSSLLDWYMVASYVVQNHESI